jgi:uncharacterized RDD family membrane protein YckC
MEIVTVQTAQNIEIEHEIGGLGERIVGWLIDFSVFIPLVIVFSFIATQLSEVGVFILGAIFSLLILFYHLVCEVFFNGQSFGKKVMKIRVVSTDGGRPRLSQFLLRWLFRPLDFAMTGGVAGLITIIVTDKSQRLGDLVAGTILIRTVPRTNINKVNYVAVPQGYEPVFQQAIQLTDRDVALIHEVIQNYVKTGNNHAVYELADKIRSHMNITIPPNMNSMQFLQTLTKDYSYITTHAEAAVL